MFSRGNVLYFVNKSILRHNRHHGIGEGRGKLVMFNQTTPQLEPETCDVDSQFVLIIDDDVDQADVLARRLQSQGFQTLTAARGQSGLRLAQNEHPDLIVLDLRLPDLDGFSVCQQLADDRRTYDIPVLILSGMEHPEVIRRVRSSGGRFYLRKPYDPNVLLMVVQNALSRIDDRCW